MAFADAVFDGRAVPDGVEAVRADDLDHIGETLARRDVIPLRVGPLAPLLSMLGHRALVDARMRKHEAPEVQIGHADLTIGLGPHWSPVVTLTS